MTNIKYRLLIPQDHFMELQRLEYPEDSFTIIWDNYILNISDKVPITIDYEHKTHPPILHDSRESV